MDVLKRVEELKRKIEELQSGSAESALPAATAKNEFSLDFVESENIHEIETGIRETLAGIALSKAALCKALANIDTKKLYKQVQAGSFLEYLEMARIPLNYKTAKEYAKIGDTMLRFREELTSVNFREEDGLKKLVYLDKALDKCGEDREAVFEKVKESSLRDFQQWIRELEEEGREQEQEQEQEQAESTCHTIDETGRPRPDIRLRNNSVFLETGPGNREEIIVTRPGQMGIDPDSPKWAGFLEQIREMLITFIQDNL
jgi:hypothetical protein